MSIRKLIIEAPQQYQWIEDWLKSKGYNYTIENIETGAGSVAVVYGIEREDKVIRIEGDTLPSQKEKWDKLVGKKLDHVVEVYMVKRIGKSVMITVMENLNPVRIKTSMEQEDILHALGEVLQYYGADDLFVLLEEMVFNIDNYEHWFTKKVVENPDLIFDMVESDRDFRDMLEQVVEGAKELDDLGIQFFDLHRNNIMVDPKTGDYKLIDIS